MQNGRQWPKGSSCQNNASCALALLALLGYSADNTIGMYKAKHVTHRIHELALVFHDGFQGGLFVGPLLLQFSLHVDDSSSDMILAFLGLQQHFMLSKLIEAS